MTNVIQKNVEDFTKRLEVERGYHLSYERIEPGFLNSFTLKGVRFSDEKGTVVEVGNIQLSHSWLSLLRSFFLGQRYQIKRLYIKDAEILIEQKRAPAETVLLEEGSDSPPAVSEVEAESQQWVESLKKGDWLSLIPLEFQHLIIRDSTVKFASNAIQAELTDFSLLSDRTKSGTFDVLSRLNIQLHLIDQTEQRYQLRGKFLFEAEIDLNGEEIAFELESREVFFNNTPFVNKTQYGSLRGSELSLRFQREEDTWLFLTVDNSTLSLRLSLEANQVSSFFAQEMKRTPFIDPAKSTLALNLDLHYNLETLALLYTADAQIKGEDPQQNSILFTTNFEGNNSVITFKELRASRGDDELEFTGSFETKRLFPNGEFSFTRRGLSDAGSIYYRLLFRSDGNNLRLFNPTPLTINEDVFFDFTANLSLENTLYEGGYSLTLKDSEIDSIQRIKGDLLFDRATRDWSLSYGGQFLPKTLPHLSREGQRREIKELEDLLFSLEGEMGNQKDVFHFDLDNFNLRQRSGLADLAELDSVGVKPLYRGRANFLVNRGEVSGSLAVNKQRESFAGSIKEGVLQLATLDQKIWIETDFLEKKARLNLNRLALLLKGEWVELSLESEIDFTDSFQISADKVEIRPQSETPLQPVLRTKILATPEKVALYDLEYNDLYSTLQGDGYWFRDDSSVSLSLIGEPTLEREREYYYIKGKIEPEPALNIEYQGSLLERTGLKELEGKASGSGYLFTLGGEPQLSLSVEIDQAVFKKEYLSVDSALRVTGDSFRFDSLSLGYGNLSVDTRYFLLNNQNLRFSFDFTSSSYFASNSINFTGMVESDGVEVDEPSWVSLFAGDWSGLVNSSSLYWNDQEYLPAIQYSISKEKDAFYFFDVEKRHIWFSHQREGEETQFVFHAISPYFPLYLISNGTIKPDGIDFKIEQILADAKLLNLTIPRRIRDPFHQTPYVIFADGLVSGNLRVFGDPADVKLAGELYVSDLAVQTPYIDTRYEIEPVSSFIFFKEDTITIPPIEFGAGPGVIRSSAEFVIRENQLTDYYVRTTLDGKEGVPVGYKVLGFEASGFMRGYFDLTNTSKHLSLGISGVEGEETAIINELVLLGSLSSEGKRLNRTVDPFRDSRVRRNDSFSLDMELALGKNPELYYPTPSLPILHLEGKEGSPIGVKYDTRTGRTILSGEVNLTSGEINYLQQQFRLDAGKITLSANSPPYLDAKASLTITELSYSSRAESTGIVIGLLAQTYIDENLIDNFKPIFSSTPPRSEQQILAYLQGSPLPDSNFTSGQSNTGFQIFSQYVEAASSERFDTIFFRPLETSLREILNLDVVQINTNFIGNALVGSLGTFNRPLNAGGSTGLNSSSNQLGQSDLRQYLDNTSIRLEKNLTEELSIGTGLQLDYFSTGANVGSLGFLQYEFSLFFNLALPPFSVGMGIIATTGERYIQKNDLPFAGNMRVGFDYAY